MSTSSRVSSCANATAYSTIATLLVASLALPACSDPTNPPSASLSGLHVQDAYIKRAVPGRKMTAAYATLINHTPDRLCFIGFEADFATRVELHVTEPVGGPDSQRVAMRQIHEHCLAQGATTTLEPGGKHLMIMGLHDNALINTESVQTPPPSNDASNKISDHQVAIRLGTSTGRLFEAKFAVVPFNYSPQNL